MPRPRDARIRGYDLATTDEATPRIDTGCPREGQLCRPVIGWLSFLADLMAADFLRQMMPPPNAP
jgi:hypothetical protein